MKILVKWTEDFGRMGDLEIVFVVEKEEFEKLKGYKATASDVLGKHSEVEIEFTDRNCTILSADQTFIAKFEDIVGTSVGFDAYNTVLEQFEYDEEQKAKQAARS